MADDEDKVREAVGVFHDERSLQLAVDELLIAGFDRSHLSLMAADRTVATKLGHLFSKVADAEDDPAVPRRAYVGIDSRVEAKGALVGVLAYVGAVASAGMVVASGGTVAAILIGAALAGGAGGLIGAGLSHIMDRHHAADLQKQLDRGGILLWVRTPDPGLEQSACAILRRHSADDVHVHSLPGASFSYEGGVSRDLSFMKKLGL